MQYRTATRLAGIATASYITVTTGANTFTLDVASPTLPTIPAIPSDVLNDAAGPGIGPPTVGLGGFTLGLKPADSVDAFSFGDDPIGTSDQCELDHLFSVTRQSLGLTGSGVRKEFTGDTAPGLSPGQAADIFHWNPSLMGSNELAPAGKGWRAGTTTGDEANTGLTNTAPFDNVASLEIKTLTHSTVPPSPPPFEVYFSRTVGSPTLGTIGATPADILAVGGVFGGTPVIFASAVSLGIPQGLQVDMDALSLKVGAAGSDPYIKDVEFSVTMASAFGWPYFGSAVTSGADLLYFDGSTGWIAHRPGEIGLRHEDDVDALETYIVQSCPGDVNHDGMVDVLDLIAVLSAWGACGGCDEDINGDGVVDVLDLLIVLSNWGPCP